MKKSTKVKKASKTGLDDERFIHLKTDPKFSGLSNREKKVVVDKRFVAALTDAKFSGRAVVDKRGRRVKKSLGNEFLDLYDFDKESDEETPHKKTKLQEESESEDEKPIKLDLARGEGNLSSSDEDESDSDWDIPESLQMEMDLAHLDYNAERVEWASHRLAACNLDWNIVKAEDIMILTSSFKPSGGRVERISIYLSDFGQERLEEEEKHGPQLKISKPLDEIQEGDDLDPETKAAVRKYQLDLLKYYYAVIECDSEATATAIYEQCDGFQFETSGLKMDLRFIPDNMEFDDNRLKERLNEDDVNLSKYKAKDKVRASVTQTDGKVQWDEVDEERTKSFHDAFNDDVHGAGLIADSESEDEETVNKRRDVLRSLLQEGEKQERLEVDWDDGQETDDDNDIKEEIKEEFESDDDSDIEKALAKRNAGYESNSDNQEEKYEPEEKVEEPKKKNTYKNYLEKRKQKRKERKQKFREAKETERDELNKVEKQAKVKQKIQKVKKSLVPTEETADKVVADDRFKALFTDSAFAIEQSSKEFKGSKLIEKQATLKKDNRAQLKSSDNDIFNKLKQKANKWEQKKRK